MQYKDYWNGIHQKYSQGEIVCDDWLDSYKSILDECKTAVLDLGCGIGNDTLYLTEKGLKVIACDYSDVALAKIKKSFGNVETKLLDISKTLPFTDSSFDLIIADLSLHYFEEKTTISIMEEIKRILNNNGHLIARVNSTADINHGAGQGKKLEENFYFIQGYNKRFFDLKDAERFFSIIGRIEIKETDMLRYSKPKKVLEVNVKKGM